MLVLSLTKTFVQEAVGKYRRARQIGRISRGDFVGYLRDKSYAFAAEHRDMGHKISDRDVKRILRTPDSFYCHGFTPEQYAKPSFGDAQLAIVAVRETIREQLGISIGRATVAEMRSMKTDIPQALRR